MSRLDKIAHHAETHDFSAEMEHGVWEDDTEPDPMITTSVRLPKSLLDWVRQEASKQHVRPSVLIRQLLEQQRGADAGTNVQDLVARVERLEEEIFPRTHTS